MGELFPQWALKDFSVDRRAFEWGLQGVSGDEEWGGYSGLMK